MFNGSYVHREIVDIFLKRIDDLANDGFELNEKTAKELNLILIPYR